jgi:hypothetical protein
MEMWHTSYESAMGMPTTRRHRLIQKKVELEQKREEKQRQADSQSRSRMRR